MASGTSEWFAVLSGVRQGCTVSPYLFNMTLALNGYDGSFRIGGRLVTNLWYADNTVLIASTREELQELVNRVSLARDRLGIRGGRRALRIPYTEHVSNAKALDRMGQQRKLLGRIKEHKMKYFGHVTRHNSLEKDVMLGPMNRRRRQGGQTRQWLDDLCDWANMSLPQLVRAAEDRFSYRKLVHRASYAQLTGTVH